MTAFEYSAIPAPLRSEKTKGAKTPSDRYAATLTEAINAMAAEGWEYLRAETLPSEERSGLTGRTTIFHNLLIFRRPLAAPVRQPEPATPATPPAAPAPQPEAQPAASPVFSEKMRVAKPEEPAEKPAED